MIAVEDARAAVLRAATNKDPVWVSEPSVPEMFLAEDFLAPYPLPLFNQSAMDGYAIRFADFESAKPLPVHGEIKAGDPAISPPSGSAMRVFTGAQIPEALDTIVMQEQARREGDQVFFEGNIREGSHLRLKGEQLQTGAVALEKGTPLNAAAFGLLKSMGVDSVSTHPLGGGVSILVTGGEFASSPADLQQGKIFESNSSMLSAALLKMGITARIVKVEDDLTSITQAIEAETKHSRILITTGGVSVGSYDFTPKALEQAGFSPTFHKVNQKPGKPLLFCQKGEQVAFGLPGNPRSALFGYYNYVYPFIRRAMGAQKVYLPSLKLPLAQDYQKRDGKVHFVTGNIDQGQLLVMGKQNSHMLRSVLDASVLIEIPAHSDFYPAGTEILAYLLPF